MAIKYEDIENKDGLVMSLHLNGTSAATGGNFDVTIPVTGVWELTKVKLRYSVASVSGTLQIQRLTNGTAPGSGTSLLTTAFDLATTANTVYSRNESDFSPSIGRVFYVGDSVGLHDGGDLTNLASLSIVFYFRPIGKGNYT